MPAWLAAAAAVKRPPWRYFKYCNGGCPALGGLYAPEKLNLFGSDVTKCLFYENGWYGKAKEAMEGWENSTRIDELG